MSNLIKRLFALLTPLQRRKFFVLQLLVVLMALIEVIGVASIVPFMALVGDMSLLESDTRIAWLYRIGGERSQLQFVFSLGIIVLVMLFISALVSTLTTWRLSIYATKIGTEIADRLYTHYLRQNWLFHASSSSAQLTKKISNETIRITGQVLLPMMHLNARIVLSVFMGVAIFVYEPRVALIGVLTFSTVYFILYKLVRKRLQRGGKAISDVYEQRFRLMNEGFGGIKEVLLLGRDQDFIDRFNKTGDTLAFSQGANTALALVPKYFVELVAFGSMMALLLYLMVRHDSDLGSILPVLSVYALAGLKLIPSFQQIYASVAQIKGNISAFESIQQDLEASMETNFQKKIVLRSDQNYLIPKQQIALQGISFTYPGKDRPALDNLSLTISANSIVGIVGPSGSGKSTLIDVILGLIEADQGKLSIDKEVITSINLRAWQNTIGFVPQSIFLSEGTIAENIAFGIPKKDIDIEQVEAALRLAYLTDLVESLEEGIDTKVGERGVRLSGGQRQRIGIARALYHRASILVFDEATSSLDGITEKMIMEAINNFSGQKTIILVAHRLKTVEKCDEIFLIDNGAVADSGTYESLLERNHKFRAMAKIS